MPSTIPVMYLDCPQHSTDLVGSLLAQSRLPLELYRAANEQQFLQLLPSQDWQAILAQINPNGFGGFEALKLLQACQRSIPVLLLSNYPGEQLAVRAIKAGASDYLLLQHSSRLLPCLNRLLLERHLPKPLNDNLAQLSLQALVDALVLVHTDGRIKLMNEAAQRLSGWSQQQAQGKALSEVLPLVEDASGQPLSYPSLEHLNFEQPASLQLNAALLNRQGQKLLIEGSMAPIRNLKGYILGLVLNFRDVSEARNLSRKLSFEASHDSLTGLVNRREFEIRLERTLTKASAQQPGALLFIDLDHFKQVNDLCGHQAGDELLRQLTQKFQTGIRERDTLARLGGDEFALLLENCSLTDAIKVAEHWLRLTRDYRFNWHNQSFKIGLSIGLVSLDGGSNQAGEILEWADKACYAAKSSGRNRYCQYPIPVVKSEVCWPPLLHAALQGSGFELMRQTMHPLKMSRQQRFEILLRYRDPSGTLHSPKEFLATAARHQLLPAIDYWVVQHSLDYLSHHPEAANTDHICSINLSTDSLTDAHLSRLLNLMQQTDIPAERLCFELSEPDTLHHFPQIENALHQLKQTGCQLALDNFGQGMAACAHLNRLPVDLLKIDASLVESSLERPENLKLLQAMNQLSHILGKTTVAGGVSTAELQYQTRQLDLDFLQGYQLSRPELIGSTR